MYRKPKDQKSGVCAEPRAIRANACVLDPGFEAHTVAESKRRHLPCHRGGASDSMIDQEGSLMRHQ
jgi:hypothetical protein